MLEKSETDDPPCCHVNYLEPLTHIANEKEMLFPPYSAFKVVSVKTGLPHPKGSAMNPRPPYVLITLLVAKDNKGHPDNLPLSPWC